MRWLLYNYFLPTLSPSVQVSTQSPTIRSPLPLLQKYKSLSKSVTRDASLRNQLKQETNKTLRDIERWMAEAKIAANASVLGFEWDARIDEDNTDPENLRERWMLEHFCDNLLEKGILVPLSKRRAVSLALLPATALTVIRIFRKRVTSSSGNFEPTEPVLKIWTPLITHVYASHRSIPSVLISKIIAYISAGSSVLERLEADTISLSQDERDASYDVCLAAWANWLVNTYCLTADEVPDNTELTREDVVVSLLRSLRSDNEGGNGKV